MFCMAYKIMDTSYIYSTYIQFVAPHEHIYITTTHMQVLVDKIVEVPVNVYVDVPEYRDKRVKKVRERARERKREIY